MRTQIEYTQYESHTEIRKNENSQPPLYIPFQSNTVLRTQYTFQSYYNNLLTDSLNKTKVSYSILLITFYCYQKSQNTEYPYYFIIHIFYGQSFYINQAIQGGLEVHINIIYSNTSQLLYTARMAFGCLTVNKSLIQICVLLFNALNSCKLFHIFSLARS